MYLKEKNTWMYVCISTVLPPLLLFSKRLSRSHITSELWPRQHCQHLTPYLLCKDAMNHGNWLRCHIPNPAAHSLTALVCDYPRSSLLRSSAASDRGEGPTPEDKPPGSTGSRAWRMEEDRSRRQQAMKMCCFAYQSQRHLLSFSLSAWPLRFLVARPHPS